MLSKTASFGLNGIDGYIVSVEVDIVKGIPQIEVVGLPDTAVKESKGRVRSAIRNSGFLFSPMRIVVNLAPADTKKEGPLYDLPIALGILCSSEQLDYKLLKDFVFVGELGLDGAVNKTDGLLPMLISAKKQGYAKIIVPFSNSTEASYVPALLIYPVKTLKETTDFLNDNSLIAPLEILSIENRMRHITYKDDFKYVKGQFSAKRALEIAAAGGHNALMIGPPGTGKTMLARCIPSILPDMTPSEVLETTKIHSVSGRLDSVDGIITSRPFRTPHHTASTAALTGGGTKATPGEISLAHNGVLFLDEMPEYSRQNLEIMRQPLEDGVITVSRVSRTVSYPANFMLVGSMNPCPCGNFGSDTNECKCTPAVIDRYKAKISGPLLDRIDLHIEVDNLEYAEMLNSEESESSAEIKKRVDKARLIQLERFNGYGIYSNSKMTSELIRKFCKYSPDGERVLLLAMERLKLSARAFDRILKVARTIADLEGADEIKTGHIAEAVQYRTMDRKYRY